MFNKMSEIQIRKQQIEEYLLSYVSLSHTFIYPTVSN